MADSKLITDPQKLRLIVSPDLPENKFILLDTDPGFSQIVPGRMPIRTELAVLPADKPSDKVTGWSITEHIGIGVINPKGVARLTVEPTMPLVCEWPLPGRSPHSIKLFYTKDGVPREGKETEPCLELKVCLYLKKPKVLHVATYTRFGFQNGKSQTPWNRLPGKTDAERLCRQVCEKEVMTIPGPVITQLLTDPLWQLIVDELPSALLTAEVMLS